MGKTEMSSILKNLKFMQRAIQKVEKTEEEEEPKRDGNFIPPSNVNKKCCVQQKVDRDNQQIWCNSVVILEGDPQPGTVRGRMSFQNFNPSIDKLKEEVAANLHEAEASTSSVFQSGRSNEGENRASEHTGIDVEDNDGDREIKRKKPKESSQTSHPKKLHKNSQGNKQPSPSDIRSSHKQPKRDQLDYNVLVPPKSHGKKKGR